MVIPVGQIAIYFLILARLGGVFIQAPLFNSRSFFTSAKVAFALWTALVLWFVTPVSPVLPTSLSGFILTLVAEVAVGFLIGFIANVMFIAIQSAGEIIDMQMGLSVAQALDPVFGAVISIIGRLTFFTALVIFLSMDGHHLLLSAFHHSFTILPAGQIANFSQPALVEQLLTIGSGLWLTAIKIAAPVILLIFLADFTFGIVSRVAPQVNVFMLGFQVKPLLGLFGISLLVPFIVKYISRLIESMGAEIVKLLLFLR
ncbi:MAG: flagellar biosynthetic protein FliR [Candidatus Margulisbacteria bacterium]|jgi:flagellar biosynthetic protein FliR|nr:flagellar biosynthetic protein FliR [Candidatus Margulisiibacteriota bacterium]